jgi:leucyl-tRNA synthetase
MEKYDHKKVEEKWQKRWEESGLYKTTEDPSKPKSYVLDMFPYPSGEGLHVGHPKGYIATDIYSRFKRMQGHNVLHPMGWDAFGLPAENYALKNKVHPRVAVEKNIATFKEQLSHIGFNYDWSREINTTDPGYYKWTQWIFLQLYKKGLAYQSNEPINWCPSCMTGLANEDLDGNVCERCGSVVEKRALPQWVLKITAYADRMLKDLDVLQWPEHIKTAQRNWIGRSEGSEIDFKISRFNLDTSVKVFTTRADTLFGATFLVLAPEHALVQELLPTLENKDEVIGYIKAAAGKTEIERTAEGKEKTGVELKGVKAINPGNGEEIPMFIADYVLGHYGTGAIMAVPAHDERDYAFAKKYGAAVRQVVASTTQIVQTNEHINETDIIPDELKSGIVKDALMQVLSFQPPFSGAQFKVFKKLAEAAFEKDFHTDHPLGFRPYVGDGILINSDKFDGLDSAEAKQKITEAVGGKMTATYKIKDWVFSRQRYWGEPIPIIHCEKDGAVAVPEDQLPVLLPDVESYEPSGTGESPLANITEWVNTTCPTCGGPAKRETNTMPQWAGSSWYYLRFMDPDNANALVSTEKEKYWAPVDVYVGGDHAVRHLIYARFWHKFLYDIGSVSTIEPFARLEFLGFILAEDGRKMSKRYGNVINPTDVVNTYGADAFRVYEMFMGPFENTVAWSTASITGTARFIDRVWRLAETVGKPEQNPVASPQASQRVAAEAIETLLHQTIKKVGEDIEAFKFNTAVSQMMIFLNAAEKDGVTQPQWESFLKILSPFAPHVTEELWAKLGHAESIHVAQWPAFDPTKTVASVVTVAVQVNGKMRATVELSKDASEAEALEIARQQADIAKHLEGKTEVKAVYVPGKIINFVLK